MTEESGDAASPTWQVVAEGVYALPGPGGGLFVSDGNAVTLVPRDALVALGKALIDHRVRVAVGKAQ